MNQKQRMKQLSEFPLLEALLGRKSRRFGLGAEIDAGPFKYKSKHPVQPLDEFEKALIISAMAGNTGWAHLIPSNRKYAPHLPNYSASASGRTFPSAAGFHSTELFFTDDNGVYFLSTRDSLPSEHNQMSVDLNIDEWLSETQKKIKKISDQRLQMPNEEPHVESHNLWVANTPGSLFAIPVSDLSQHMLLFLCYLLQNGYVVFDDINKRQIPGIEKFGKIADLKSPYPLSYAEQFTITEATVELSTSCYSGALLLQAMGLGGWMYDGIDFHSVFGVSGDPRNKGLGFRADNQEGWNFPNPTGIPGVFDGCCPPHYKNMHEAVKAVIKRKFGEGGPYNKGTEGPWREAQKIRGAATPHEDNFVECVTLQAQYIFDTFNKFPATIPSTFAIMYLQAFHLDTDFYDHFYKPGSYLRTHAEHQKTWHT